MCRPRLVRRWWAIVRLFWQLRARLVLSASAFSLLTSAATLADNVSTEISTGGAEFSAITRNADFHPLSGNSGFPLLDCRLWYHEHPIAREPLAVYSPAIT